MAEKPTHVVVRDGFYRRFGGKLQSIPVGTEVWLSDQAAHRLVKNGTVKAIDKPVEKPASTPKEEKAIPETEAEPEQEKPKPKRKYKKKKSKE